MHWTVHLEGGPRRVNHAAVSVDDKVFSFGGYCSGEDYEIRRPMDVHVLDTEMFRWRSLSVPSVEDPQYYETPYQRYGHTAVVHSGKAYVWGGRNDSDGASSVLHEFDPATNRWARVKVSGLVPPSRDGHSACVIGDEMIVFGGFEEEFQRFSQETFIFNFKTRIWREIKAWGTAPPWRDFHTATAIGSRMYIFGGRSDQLGQFHSNREIYYDKVKYLDLEDMAWHEPQVFGNPPTGRRSHSAWSYNGKLYIFGGYSGMVNQHFDTIYEYNPVSSVWRVIATAGKGPKPRRRQCCVVCKDKMFLFGGTAPIDGKSPIMLSSPNFTDDAALYMSERNLIDLSDLFVLDFSPSLKTLSCLAVLKNRLHESHDPTHLPWDLRLELQAMILPNRITGARIEVFG